MTHPNLTKYKDELKKLISRGAEIRLDLSVKLLEREGKLDKEHKQLKEKVGGMFEKGYQRWYTEAFAVIKQLLPDRLEEFEAHYKPDPRRKNVDATTYKIQDWLTGMRSSERPFTGEKFFDDLSLTISHFHMQFEILQSAELRFESSLIEIRQFVQADLFDSELDAARELQKTGFLRGSGVIAGVVLEKHLSLACANHNVSIRKQHPTISDLNDALKNDNVIDVPTWRFIQRLGDLRNICGHNKNREPTEDEVSELINGVDKITKTVY